MCSSSLEGKTQGLQNPLLIQTTRSDQKSQVHQVLHSTVRSVPRERVGVNLLGELLFARDRPNPRRFDAGESQPVPADDGLKRLHNHIANAGVQVESGEDPFVHSSFDGIAGPPVRRGGQIHGRRSDRVLEPVTERDVSHFLQHLPYNPIRVIARRCCCHHSLQRQVDVHRGSSSLEAQLQRITTLQNPGRWFFPEQPCQQTVEGHFPPEAVEIDLIGQSRSLQAFFKSLSECSGRRICSGRRHYAARRDASSATLRAGPLIRVVRICCRVIRPRSIACLSAWRMKFRSTVPDSIRSRIVRRGRVNLKP